MLYFAMLRKTIWIRVVWVTQRRPGHNSSSPLSRSVDFRKIGIRKYSTPNSCVPGRASYPRFREVTMRNQLEAIYRATFNPFHRVAIERSTASYPAGIFRMRVGYSLTGVVSPFEMNETVRISLSSPPLTCSPVFENPIDSEDRLWKLFRIGEYGGGLGASFCGWLEEGTWIF